MEVGRVCPRLDILQLPSPLSTSDAFNPLLAIVFNDSFNSG